MVEDVVMDSDEMLDECSDADMLLVLLIRDVTLYTPLYHLDTP